MSEQDEVGQLQFPPGEATPLTVVQALNRCMRDVQAVKKSERNQQQGFSFRGIDNVTSAVGPALREHGVVVVPLAETVDTSELATAKGTVMRNVVLRCRWRFHGPAGDWIDAVTYGEASDAGDKAVSKAHSVAYRTALLQALCIPTDEPDPDEQVHDRAAPTQQAPAYAQQAKQRGDEAIRRVVAAAKQRDPESSDQDRKGWIQSEMESRNLDMNNPDHLNQFAGELEQLASVREG